MNNTNKFLNVILHDKRRKKVSINPCPKIRNLLITDNRKWRFLNFFSWILSKVAAVDRMRHITVKDSYPPLFKLYLGVIRSYTFLRETNLLHIMAEYTIRLKKKSLRRHWIILTSTYLNKGWWESLTVICRILSTATSLDSIQFQKFKNLHFRLPVTHKLRISGHGLIQTFFLLLSCRITSSSLLMLFINTLYVYVCGQGEG